ncbi:T9SS type A sorting domain-containing protein [Aquimarina sp. ERC-38]|uniref:T9SS type A sorting domain-containing protein n=1 Tax=Aquimarina sp. ERC-38 TaxID=2949996 RepID=UPI0022465287|nr:T9SS type A sorting domain-containing protein [Aquimarina sp. ERC-38]UZO79431.1 T9SS type A sorting domain-containing protein [Aquimarina sp. ERC-38]
MTQLNNSMKVLLCFLIAVTVQYVHAKQVPYKGANADHRAEILNAIKSLSPKDNEIEFLPGKVYGLKGTLNIPAGKRIVFKTSNNSNKKAILKVTSNRIGNLITLNRVVRFNNIIIDGGGNTSSNSYGILVNVNNTKNVQFINCDMRNFNGIGIASRSPSIPNYTDGLVVKGCNFSNISGNSVILLIDRRTNKRDGKGNLIGGKKNALASFSSPVVIENSRFTGKHSVAIRSDCGNDFYKIPGEQGVRRYRQSTDLNATIRNNFFGATVRWNIGMVQVSGATFADNTFEGGGTTGKGSGACFHIEQFCTNITIKNNTFNIKRLFGIAFAAKEGYKRYTETPIRLFDNKGGRAHSFAEASPRCTQNRPFMSSRKTCKRDVHSYGPRNFNIYGNRFNAVGNNVKTALQIRDAEDFYVGNAGKGKAKNTYSGKFSSGRIVINRGDLGNKNVIINDNLKACQINIKGDIWFKKNKSNVKLNGANLTGCGGTNRSAIAEDGITDSLSELAFYPNPATDITTIQTIGNSEYIVEFFTLAGKSVLKEIVSAGSGTHDLNLTSLSSGHYIVKFNNAQETVIKKLVVN